MSLKSWLDLITTIFIVGAGFLHPKITPNYRDCNE